MSEGPDRLTDGVVHLQAAAKEMIHAARAVLDVLEDLVDDPDRVVDVVEGAGAAMGEVLHLANRRSRPAKNRPSNPWFDQEWTGGGDDRGPDEPAAPATSRRRQPQPAEGDFERIDLG